MKTLDRIRDLAVAVFMIAFWLSMFYSLYAFVALIINDPKAGAGITVFVGTTLVFLRGVYLLLIGLWNVSSGYRERVRQAMIHWAIMRKSFLLIHILMTTEEFAILKAGLQVIERQRKYRAAVKAQQDRTPGVQRGPGEH